jgi:uncharacterized protein YndB with AHSA1/START domain
MEKVTAKASIGIQKPVSEVFEAIINPEIMQNYFISKGSEEWKPVKKSSGLSQNLMVLIH